VVGWGLESAEIRRLAPLADVFGFVECGIRAFGVMRLDEVGAKWLRCCLWRWWLAQVRWACAHLGRKGRGVWSAYRGVFGQQKTAQNKRMAKVEFSNSVKRLIKRLITAGAILRARLLT
jgi:hypothetical protein